MLDAALKVIGGAMQAHGAAGCGKGVLSADMYASIRTIRTVDGPDEMRRNGIAKAELKTYLKKSAKSGRA